MAAEERAFQHLRFIIDKLKLDLTGLTVLTEIGNNYYFYLPFIAAMAGAEKVYARTAENKYFEAKALVAGAVKVAAKKGFGATIEFSINDHPVSHVREADIITNSGFLRPLNESLLKDAKAGAVIPLMFEAWELRDSDIDITYCKKKNIRVAGTNENHPSINVFESVGPLAVKLAMEAGMEVFGNKILVWSDDAFGSVTKKYFEAMNASEVLLTVNKQEALHFLPGADFIYFCPNHEKQTLISDSDEDAIFSLKEISNANPNISIIHLYGKFELKELEENGFHVHPAQDGRAEYMSRTLTHIGMKPTLNLLAAGLKVGEEMIRNKCSDLSQPIC